MSGIKYAVVGFLGIGLMAFASCNPMNRDSIKRVASDVWERQGFEVVDYEGYQFGPGIPGFGGARVWHRLRKKPDNGITYSGYIVKWGDEYHVYGPMALDAIRPN